MKVSELKNHLLFQSPRLVEWKYEGVLYRFQKELARVSVRNSSHIWESYKLDKACLRMAKRKVCDLILDDD